MSRKIEKIMIGNLNEGQNECGQIFELLGNEQWNQIQPLRCSRLNFHNGYLIIMDGTSLAWISGAGDSKTGPPETKALKPGPLETKCSPFESSLTFSSS